MRTANELASKRFFPSRIHANPQSNSHRRPSISHLALGRSKIAVAPLISHVALPFFRNLGSEGFGGLELMDSGPPRHFRMGRERG